jgi:hypothetical protein
MRAASARYQRGLRTLFIALFTSLLDRAAVIQLHHLAGDDRDKAVPVVLDLVQPAVALWRLCARRGKLDTDLVRRVGRERQGGQQEAHRSRDIAAAGLPAQIP